MGTFFKWNKCRILTADDFLYIYDKFGADAAKNILRRVQEGRMTVGALEKYIHGEAGQVCV